MPEEESDDVEGEILLECLSGEFPPPAPLRLRFSRILAMIVSTSISSSRISNILTVPHLLKNLRGLRPFSPGEKEGGL